MTRTRRGRSSRHRRSSHLARTAAAIAIVLASLAVVAPASASTPTVESTYRLVGRWDVATSSAVDADGAAYDLWYPSDLGAGGTRHPIIAWANGTLTPTAHYAGLLRHLASWGFVVVAPSDTWTGSGTKVLAAIDDLVSRGQDPQSPFYGKLDVTRIGALGHSQGAYGILNATLRSNGLIRTAVPINLPDLVWLSPLHAADLSALTQPILLVGGANDWLSTPAGLLAYLNLVPSAVYAAVLSAAPHDGVATNADAYLGYVTAWMMYQLQGDSYAASAFVGDGAEIMSNPEWAILAPSAPHGATTGPPSRST